MLVNAAAIFANITRPRRGSQLRIVVTWPACQSAPIAEAPRIHPTDTRTSDVPISTSGRPTSAYSCVRNTITPVATTASISSATSTLTNRRDRNRRNSDASSPLIAIPPWGRRR